VGRMAQRSRSHWLSRIRAMPRLQTRFGWRSCHCSRVGRAHWQAAPVFRISEIARVAQSATLRPVPARNLQDLLEALTGSG
jgi:hypothetical protein